MLYKKLGTGIVVVFLALASIGNFSIANDDVGQPEIARISSIGLVGERRANPYLQRKRIRGSYRPRKRGFFPPDILGARLPHLRIDIRVTSVEATFAAAPAPFGDFFAVFNLSGGLSVDVEALTTETLPLPSQLETSSYNRTIYSAVVLNGCSETTTINLRGDMLVDTWTGGDLGSIELNDEVVGNGYYSMNIPFVATNSGQQGALEYVISGEVPVYCTNATGPSTVD